MNQVLSQDEINALLKGLDGGEIEQDAKSEPAGPEPRNYDLASQERIIRGRMPTMELIHDRFSRSFRTAVSKFLGRACFVNVGAIEIIKFGAFLKKLPLPSSLHVYKMPPLQGYALMVVSTPLVFGIVDSLFGGKGTGKAKIEGREYTPIETRLISKFVLMGLETMKDAWSPVHPVDFMFIRSEFNPLAIGIVPPTDMVIIVTIEVELEQQTATLTFCTPYSTIEPIRQKLMTGLQSSRLEVDTNAIKRMETAVRKTNVSLSVELARGGVSARTIAELKVGDIIPLETSPREPAIISVENTAKYLGYVGTFQGSRAVKVIGPYVDQDTQVALD